MLVVARFATTLGFATAEYREVNLSTHTPKERGVFN